MLLFTYISLLILFLVLMIKHRIGFLIYILPASFALDLLTIFFDKGGITAIARGGVFIYFLLSSIILLDKYAVLNSLYRKRYYNILLVLLILLSYWLFLILFSSNKFNSIREYSRILVILLMFPAGFTVGTMHKNTHELFRKLNNSFVLILLFATINIIVANVFKINQIEYTSLVNFYSGGLQLSGWYTLPLSILFVLGYRMILEKSKVLLHEKVLIFLNILWILLSWRRTGFLVLILGLLFFLYYSKMYVKFFINIVIIGAAAFVLIGNAFLHIYEGRKKTIDKGIEEEGRFLESEWVYGKIFSFEDWKISLFGKELFNTAGNYLGGLFGDRPMHVDINIILWGSGLVGLFLYTLFHLLLFLYFNRLINRSNFPRRLNTFAKFLFLYFFFATLMISFSGGLQALTFRSVLIFTMGILLGHLSRLSNRRLILRSYIPGNLSVKQIN